MIRVVLLSRMFVVLVAFLDTDVVRGAGECWTTMFFPRILLSQKELMARYAIVIFLIIQSV